MWKDNCREHNVILLPVTCSHSKKKQQGNDTINKHTRASTEYLTKDILKTDNVGSFQHYGCLIQKGKLSIVSSLKRQNLNLKNDCEIQRCLHAIC